MVKDWKPRPLTDLGDCIGEAVLLICEYGAFEGGLKSISSTDIHIEVGQGQVIAISRDVLLNDLTELYTLEVI